MYIPGAFFSTELFWSVIKWLMILGIWAMFAWGAWREDRKIRQLLEGKNESAPLLQILQRRDRQIWIQLSLLLVVVAVNDIQHDAALLPQDFFLPPAPAVIPAVKEDIPTDKYDSVLKKSGTQGLPFSDITEFNERNSKQEAYIDWLKEHYESWLVTYYYLQKCKTVGAEDFDLIQHSLEKELDSAHAGANVKANILLAATGSYREMYADIPCDSPNFAATKSLYDANMQQIKTPPTPNSAESKPAPSPRPDNSR